MNILLVGNPNVGKSVLFNALTGRYVTVSNYPGTTVEVSKGVAILGGRQFSVIDTPGVNSLVPHSEDEKVTRDIVSRAGIACVVHVMDAKNLKRSLALTLELMALKVPIVLNLNMADEAAERGIRIDVRKLSEHLGVEVVETVATTKEGIPKLKEAITKARAPDAAALKKLAGKGAVSSDKIISLRQRTKLADALVEDVVSVSRPLKKNISEKISRLMTKPLTGVPILLAVLAVLYIFVGKFAAGTLVDILEHGIFERHVNPFFVNMISRLIPVPVIRDLLVGEYGVITMAMTYSIAIIFPIVTAFFIFFGILEDSGYLPRLSVLSDRLFKTMGLNGRAVLPMVLGLGCGTMATLTARILDTKKERILVSLLLTLAIPCSAQLGVIMGMLGSSSMKALAVWVGIILSVMIIVGLFASKIVPGARTPFIQEIPPIRLPQMRNILVKTAARLKWYLKEAVPLFVLGTLVLFISDKTGLLKMFEHFLRPLIVDGLGLPAKATESFIVGFLRRDYGAAGLYVLARAGQLDKIQMLVSLVVITLFVPCIAQLFVTIKERGFKTGCAIGSFVFVFAFLVGYILNFALRHLAGRGITIL